MEQFLAKSKRNNLEASLKEAEEAFKVDKKAATNTAAQTMLILRKETP